MWHLHAPTFNKWQKKKKKEKEGGTSHTDT
jgi:hypothetical protein